MTQNTLEIERINHRVASRKERESKVFYHYSCEKLLLLVLLDLSAMPGA